MILLTIAHPQANLTGQCNLTATLKGLKND
jgi:hypothetical protein